MEDEIEKVEAVPEGAVPMKPIQGPDGSFYLVPDTQTTAPVADPKIEEGAAASESLFGWTKPIIEDPLGWAEQNLLNADILLPIAWQVGAVLGVLILGAMFAPRSRKWILSSVQKAPEKLRSFLFETLPQLVRPTLWAAGLYAAEAALDGAGMDSTLVRIALSLSLAWLLIRLVTTFLPEGLRKPAAWIIWIFAAFYAFGVLEEVITWLSSIGPEFADKRISPVFIVQAIVTVGMFMFAASWLARQLKTRVDEFPKMEPSLRILTGNAVQVGLFFAAALLALAGLGIPLSGLAVLGGAIGVGLGFGMQQIVANFISGVILLTDRSIKPDDVIEVDETYGVVKSLGLRYASVITRDGKEHLIPNEQLITDRVVNWSYSNKQVRIKRRLRVEYETDLRTACDLVVKGLKVVPRILAEPAPKCLVMEFGEEAVEIEARFWIEDPQNGINNVGSEAMLSVWDEFQQAGIDIPMRHEDVLITPGSTLKVEMVPSTKPETEEV